MDVLPPALPFYYDLLEVPDAKEDKETTWRPINIVLVSVVYCLQCARIAFYVAEELHAERDILKTGANDLNDKHFSNFSRWMHF